MPLFLEELNLRSWTVPQGCPYCSALIDLTLMVDISLLLERQKQVWRKYLCCAPFKVLLYANREGEDTFFSLPYGHAWDLQDAVGSRILEGEEGAAIITHNSIWPEVDRCLAAMELPKPCSSVEPQFFPCFWLLWVKVFKPAMAESHVWRVARATIGDFQWEAPQGCCCAGIFLFIWYFLIFINFIFPFLQGWLP